MRLTEEPKVKVSVRMPALYMKMLRDMAYNNGNIKSVNRIVVDAISIYIDSNANISDNTVYRDYEIATFLIPVSVYAKLSRYIEERKISISEAVRNSVYYYLNTVVNDGD